MDNARAKRMTEELTGRTVAGWSLESFLGAGKSALVFRARNGAQEAAVKIFDPELVERFGKDVQAGRIQRELALRGKEHRNLVQIIDGGETTDGLFYVAMGLVEAPSLGTLVDRLPRERIWPLISQVSDAAQFLESCSLAHRDIKPDNIALGSDLALPVLLDLGVIRPIGLGDLTDEDSQKPFVGTLRYSPPELLVRTEDDTVEGWRAITFYQLGAVLHDLIMRRRLFDEYGEPYALLVDAVRSIVPTIEASDVSPDLVLLARNCLVKDPKLRLQLVSWSSFQPRSPASPALDARARMEKRLAARQIEATDLAAEQDRTARKEQRAVSEIQGIVERIVRQECTGNPLFPPLESRQISIPKGAELRVCFGTSAGLGLDLHVQVWLRLSLLDEPARVVEVGAAVGLSREHSSGGSSGEPPLVVLFRGVFQDTVVAPLIKDLLYAAVDRAQQQLSSDRVDPGSNDVKWLSDVAPVSLGVP